MPKAAPWSSAQSRHRVRTGHCSQIRLTRMVSSNAGPDVPSLTAWPGSGCLVSRGT